MSKKGSSGLAPAALSGKKKTSLRKVTNASTAGGALASNPQKFISQNDIPKIIREADAHKGQSGRVLVIGGSENYVGAPALAGLAALRSGADLVTIAAPEKAAWAINRRSYDLITTKLRGRQVSIAHVKTLKELLEKNDVLLMGNGLSVFAGTKEVVDTMAAWPGMKVLDADALKVVSTKNLSNAILTPHKEELRILLRNNKTAVEDIVAKGNIVIVKGKIDEIHLQGDILYNKTGNARMAVGGTGDVLAGLCAGLLSQYKDLRSAAIAATFINGLLGDELIKEKGFSFTAEDMVGVLPRVLLRLGLHEVHG